MKEKDLENYLQTIMYQLEDIKKILMQMEERESDRNTKQIKRR